jgi:hypothetical protein
MARRLALAAALVSVLAVPALAEIVPVTRAGEYVGRDVTVEGRVVAVYDSPLATVLGFAPNFAGFTATILAADRAKFPGDVEERYRGKLVQLTGSVTAYRGKPEMPVRDPSQVKVVTDPNATPTPIATRAAVAPTPQPEIEEMRQTMATLEARVAALEARVAGAEQTLAALNPPPPPPPTGLAIGADAAAVRRTLGSPREVQRRNDGTEVWSYGTGRTVTFDTNGRVVVWTGFAGL